MIFTKPGPCLTEVVPTLEGVCTPTNPRPIPNPRVGIGVLFTGRRPFESGLWVGDHGHLGSTLPTGGGERHPGPVRCPTKNPNFFGTWNYFFPVQLVHLKLSGYGLLSTQGVQSRSQNCRSISQSEVILQYMRGPGAPAQLGPKGVNLLTTLLCM